MGPVLLYIKLTQRLNKKEILTNVSHKFGIKSFHSHTYKLTKWIQHCIKTSLDSFSSFPKSGHITYLFIGFKLIKYTDSSVQFSLSVMSNSLWSHESMHTRPPGPSQTPGVYSKSCPSSRWLIRVISSSVVCFSCCPQSLPASQLVSQ